MIKLIATLTMLIDHIGLLLYPASPGFRMIGRLSMPLFAYCIARGFYYSKKHNTVSKYMMNMLMFAIASQIPYWYMTHGGLNIGFTWLFSLLLLLVSTKRYKSQFRYVLSVIVAYGTVLFLVGFHFLPVDYGIYGIATPLLFYYLIKSNKENTVNYTLVLATTWMYYVFIQHGGILQIISIFSGFILTVSKNFDKKIELPKWVFYTFYPVHIMILLMIKQIN